MIETVTLHALKNCIEMPLAFACRSLTSAKLNYAHIERKAPRFTLGDVKGFATGHCPVI